VTVELVIRARPVVSGRVVCEITATALFIAVGCLLLGTYFFTKAYWGPAIAHRVPG